MERLSKTMKRKLIQDDYRPGWNLDQGHSKYNLEHNHYADQLGDSVLWISVTVINSFNHRPGSVFIHFIFIFDIKLNSVLNKAGFSGTNHLIFAAALGTLPSSVTYWTCLIHVLGIPYFWLWFTSTGCKCFGFLQTPCRAYDRC